MESAWTGAVCLLGGDRHVAAAAAADLAARYAEPHRRYHGVAHMRAVVRDTAILARELCLTASERAVLTIAAGAHDVVYDRHPGDDERRSASWARDWLTRAGVAHAHVSRTGELVLATMAHLVPPGDLTAWALLDADLAILGADPGTYDRYRAAVREEYAAIRPSRRPVALPSARPASAARAAGAP